MYVACDSSSWKLPLTSHSDQWLLNHSASKHEIKEMVFQMDAHKAFGLNCILPLFYYNYLDYWSFMHWLYSVGASGWHFSFRS